MGNEELLPDNGELMSLQEFIHFCEIGLFIDTDGSGYYSDGRVFWREKPAIPSDIIKYKISFDTKHRYVIWFNK